MSDYINMVQNFEQSLIDFAKSKRLDYIPHEQSTKTLTVGQRTRCGKVYNAVTQFLNSANLYRNSLFSLDICPTMGAGREGFECSNIADGQLTRYQNTLFDLCTECDIPQSDIMSTISGLANNLAKYCNSDVMTEHFSRNTAALGSEGYRPSGSIYPAAALSDVTFDDVIPGKEAFGATVDTVIPDLKMALTITLLKPFRGIMSRFMHRTTTAQSVITYVVHNDEYYNLVSSQDKSAEVRYGYEHRKKLITLYRDPSPVDMTLNPVVVIKTNDLDGDKVYEDGVLKFGVTVNLFELAGISNKIGYDKYNYTDLLSERIILDKVYVKITKESTSEIYKLDTSTYPQAQLNMMQTTQNDSGDKHTLFKAKFPFSKDSKTTAGAATTIFSAVDPAVEYVILTCHLGAQVNIMTSYAAGMASHTISVATTKKDTAPSSTIKTLAGELTVEFLGYELDAKYSEENLRKTSMAARSLTNVFTYELPQGKTCVVDFSMQQSLPEHVLNVAQEIQSIGIDHRNIQIFEKTLKSVHDRVLKESTDPEYIKNFENFTVNAAYVSGQKVNPDVILATIDLRNVVSIRSSDALSDVNSYFMAYLNKSISMMHYRSLYLQNLGNGEAPTYKALTSNIILENLFSLPNIHAHLMPEGLNGVQLFKEKNPGENVEFTAKLYSGTRIELITTAFDYMKNKIMLVPYRPNDPSSDLNFGQNHDGGQFVANYMPTDGNNAVNRRVFVNTREFPIVLCPIGAIYTIEGLETILPDIINAYSAPATTAYTRMV